MSRRKRTTRPVRSERRQSVIDARAEAAEAAKIWPEKVIGAKYVRLLDKVLRDLERSNAHGNQRLFLDDVFVVYLLAFFNPTIRSLRTIEDFSQTQQAQAHLSVGRICKSTLSDFNQLADPERLVPLLNGLRGELSRKQAGSDSQSRDLHELLKRTVAVDGTFLHAVANVAWAVANSNNHGATRHRARLDAQIHVTTWLPEAIVVPDPGQSEADSAIPLIQTNRIYIYDRGYSSFSLVRAHYESSSEETETSPAVKAHFVIRYKKAGGNSPTLNTPVDRPLTAEDQAAGVISDRVGYFTSESAQREHISGLLLREVVIPYEENGEAKTLRLVTNLLDVSAATIALLYQHRWQVELFFRWLKSIGHFERLISHSRQGVLTHLYVTIIAMLLVHLHTGLRPSKYMFALLGQVTAGAATLDEILPILRERERRAELDRQSAARRRAKKKDVSQ